MNFLRHSFSSISEPPTVPFPAQQTIDAAADREAGKPPIVLTSTLDSDGEDAARPVDVIRTRNKVPIEDHVDVPDDVGGICIPRGVLPEDWYLIGDMRLLTDLDRSFLFPGERLSIVAYVSTHDASLPEIITPFRVAAMLGKASSLQVDCEEQLEMVNDGSSANSYGYIPSNTRPPLSDSLPGLDGYKNRNAVLLDLFQRSHFFTRFMSSEEKQSWKNSVSFELCSDDLEEELMLLSNSDSTEPKSPQSSKPIPVAIEGGEFNPKCAGGVARNASCYSFESNIIAVVLDVTVSMDLKSDAVLEILQFEQPWESINERSCKDKFDDDVFLNSSAEQLLQWMLPLDVPPSPLAHNIVPASSSSIVNSSPQRPSFSASSLSSSGGSTLFSFANLRSYSTVSSQSVSTAISSASLHSYMASYYGSNEWEKMSAQRQWKDKSASSEGLLSFRGAQLEPQRFSVHCGLEGLYIPGRRWIRKLQIVEPVRIESYFADFNTKDLLCVLIENTVPEHLADVTIVVDSISVVCESAGPNSMPLSVPIACVEVGEDHKLPGLSLRPGEQHSFILKPLNSPCMLINGQRTGVPSLSVPDTNNLKRFSRLTETAAKKNIRELYTTSFQESGSYALIVSCQCSHTGSRLHFKQPVKWHPRSPRDLLLSVSVDPTSVLGSSGACLSSLMPKIITMQATNLTAENMHLTLLAPSSKNSSTSMQFPFTPSSRASSISSFTSFHEKKDRPNVRIGEKDHGAPKEKPNSASLQRSMSLPPVRPIESIMGITPRVVKERAISAADIAAEYNSTRTHLWLQSIVPLGSVPPQSTTTVRCELLPLTDGIITLDTLQIASKERDLIYIPEQPLQIHATSSIGIGLL